MLLQLSNLLHAISASMSCTEPHCRQGCSQVSKLRRAPSPSVYTPFARQTHPTFGHSFSSMISVPNILHALSAILYSNVSSSDIPQGALRNDARPSASTLNPRFCNTLVTQARQATCRWPLDLSEPESSYE